jgi:acetyl-CoA C-acetyltransferase
MDVAIVGIGMHPFGRHEGVSGMAQGAHAARLALADAGIGWQDVQSAFGGSAAAGNPDSLVSTLGLTGIPFVNVYNGCATGGSALAMGERAIRSGDSGLTMVIGFDKHPRGAFNANPESSGLGRWYGETGMMLTTQFFGMKIQRYLHEHGLSRDILAKVSAKAFRNGSLNPNAWRRKPLTEEEIASAPMLSDPLTQYMFCNPAEGAVALILCPADQAHRYTDRPVYVKAISFKTRKFGSFEVFSPWLSPDRVAGPTVEAAAAVFETAGVGPEDMDLAQLQDTDAGAEIMHMAETGFCNDGDQEALLSEGATEIGGRIPVNTDGGCLANGEPIGASGLRQVYENVLQLRGDAGDRQVPGRPRAAFTHVYGAPGLSACTILTR